VATLLGEGGIGGMTDDKSRFEQMRQRIQATIAETKSNAGSPPKSDDDGPHLEMTIPIPEMGIGIPEYVAARNKFAEMAENARKAAETLKVKKTEEQHEHQTRGMSI
jgi:hypothetical protein